MQVALDPPPLGLGRVHHPLAAALQLGDPGRQRALRPEQAAADRCVGEREAPGQLGRGEQQHQPGDGRCGHLRPAAHDRPVDDRAAARQRPVVQRQGEQHQAECRCADADRHRRRADRQPQQGVADLAPGGAGAQLAPARYQQPVVAGAIAPRPGGDRHPEQDREPGPLEAAEPVGEPQREAEQRQAGQRQRDGAEAERDAEGDDEDHRGPDEQPDQMMDEGEPGAR
jgi:hypothetical protein